MTALAPPAAAAAPPDPSDAAGAVDSLLNFIHDDLLVEAQGGAQSMPSVPRPAFLAYNKWLTAVETSIIQKTDLTHDPQYAATAKDAYNELVQYSGVHYQCLNIASCRDTDLQRAEHDGLDLGAVGAKVANYFGSQDEATKNAAIAHLRQAYRLP